MTRLFLAIELPEEQRQDLFSLAKPLVHVRQVGQHQLHLTLKFLGEQKEEDLQDIIDSLTPATLHPQFNLKISGTGIFKKAGRPAVIWAGINHSSQLVRLHKKLDQLLVHYAAKEKRAFSPHITLARIQKRFDPQQVENFLSQCKDFTLPAFSVKHLTLFESRLLPHGARHIPLAHFALTEKIG